MQGKAALLLLATVLFAGPAEAQEPQQQPTDGVVVSLNMCNFGAVEELNQMVRQHWAPVLDRAVREGNLSGWGVLTHMWGDEYNWVVYYAGPNAGTLSQRVSALLGEIFGAMPGDAMSRFGGMCTAHKDNIYAVAVAQGAQPPSGGGGPDGEEPDGPRP